MRVLISGGTGFIGSYLSREFVLREHDVTILTRNPKSTVSNLSGKADYLYVDLRDRVAVIDALRGRSFDYVIHCGGSIEHRSFFERGDEVIEHHLSGLYHLVQGIDRSSLECFLMLGSSDEYGSTTAPQKESEREAPISPYAYAKCAATQFLQMLHRTTGFPAAIFRLFLIYGPGQGPERFLPQIVRGCLDDASFPVSRGEQFRDFLFVEDLVEAVTLVPVRPQVLGRVVNVASGQPVQIRDLIEQIKTIAGGGKPRYGEIPYRTGENMNLYAEISLARELLGWQPHTTLNEGLRRTIEYFRSEIVPGIEYS